MYSGQISNDVVSCGCLQFSVLGFGSVAFKINSCLFLLEGRLAFQC